MPPISSLPPLLPACPVCTNAMSPSSVAPSSQPCHQALGLVCCGQICCQTCLYQHLQAIFDEGLSRYGRVSLACPLGCGQELSDAVVRATIDRANPLLWIWKIIGIIILQLAISFSAFLRLILSSDVEKIIIVSQIRYFWSHSHRAISDLQRYHQWSLVVALRKESTLRCPVPGCGYQWITNPLYRKHKLAHEMKPTYLWYSPPKPDKTRTSFHWIEPESLVPPPKTKTSTMIVGPDLKRDGRRMVCAKCSTVFCGLCRNPWEGSTERRHGFHSIGSHHGITCSKYACLTNRK